MTLSTTSVQVSNDGDGTTTVFSVPFAFFGADEIDVWIEDSSGVRDDQVRGVDYVVTGGGGATGAIAITPAVASGSTLYMRRDSLRTQTAAFSEGDPLPATALGAALDRAFMVAQELGELAARCIRVPEGEAALSALGSATDRANMLLGFDASGLPTLYGSTAGAVALSDLPTAVQQVPVTFSYEGKPIAGQTRVVVLAQPYVIPADFAGTKAWFNTAATAASAFILRVRASGTIVTHGTVSINAGGTVTLPVVSARTLAAGDAFLFDPPSPADATLADGGWTILLNRA